MTISTFTHADLALSPLNVRTNEEDANATSALEASILAHGLLFPLIVHPLPEIVGRAHWGVLAGGRRWRAIGRLIGNGDLPTDWPIDAVVRDLSPAEITEMSLAENLLRRELRGHEVHAAIARAASQGASVEEIAGNIGQRVSWVRQQLRLGTLVPEIFTAYADGQITLDQARAYAATEDEDLQRAAWAHFERAQSWDHTPFRIHAFLKVGDEEAERLLRFVGHDAYRAAGGRYELDLFAEGGPDDDLPRGRVVDQALLRQLTENQLAAVRDAIRADCGDADLRFAARPPQIGNGTDFTLEIDPVITSDADGRLITLPDGAHGDAVIATLDISRAGEPNLRFWWASRKARKAALESTTDSDGGSGEGEAANLGDGDAILDRGSPSAAQARTLAREEHGLTADGLQIVRSLRRDVLRDVLVYDAQGNGDLARDYLVWAQLRMELGPERTGAREAATGMRCLSSEWNGRDPEPSTVASDWLDGTLAREYWEDAVGWASRLGFMQEPDPAESFAQYQAEDDDVKRMATAVLVGFALVRSANAPGWRVPVHDYLAGRAGHGNADTLTRRFWDPTPKFMGLFPKMKRLEMAQPHVEPDAFRAWSKLDDATLAGASSGALPPDWVHPLLSFIGEGVSEVVQERQPVGAS